MTDFLHGIESQQINKEGKTIQVVNSAVIALIGTAPMGAVNTLKLVTNPKEAEQFGAMLTGFTIPQALDAIFKQKAGAVLVVNVADVSTAITAVTEESHVIANRKIKTTHHPIGTITSVTNSAGSTTYVAGTDYTADVFGNITILNNGLAEGVTLKANYNKYDATAVEDTDIIGADTDGVKTGCKLMANAYNTFGIKPKLILIPKYCETDTVQDEMFEMSKKYRAIAIVDAPSGTSVPDAITGRGPSGTIGFNQYNDKRMVYAFPYQKAYDGENNIVNTPYSQWLMGLIANVDANEGYWVSPSNHQINGVLGNEVDVSFDVSDKDCQANQLNAKGIVTCINRFPENQNILKPHAWGNRSSLFPSSTEVITFVAGQRVLDIIDDSVELYSIPFIDKPINGATMDTILEDVNKLIRTLVGRGALIDGFAYIDPAENTPEDLAAGKFTVSKNVMFPTPMERIVHKTFVDISLLKALVG